MRARIFRMAFREAVIELTFLSTGLFDFFNWLASLYRGRCLR